MKNLNKKTQALLLSSVFILILALSIYTFLGLFIIYFLPIPFIIYTLMYGYKNGIILAVINIIIATILAQLSGLFLGFLAASVGISMGYLYKKGNALQAYVGGIIVTIINLILLLTISYAIFDINIVESLNNMLASSLESVEAILQQSGKQEQTEFILESYRSFFASIEQLLPLIIIFYSIFFITVNHFLVRRLGNKLKIEIPKFPPVREWNFPKSIIFYYLIVVLIVMIKPLSEIYTLNLIAMNLYPLLQLVLIIQGVSFIFYYSHYKNWGKTVKVLTVIAAFLPLLSQIILYIGLIDIGFDLRKKLKV